MDFSLTPEEREFQAEVRAFIKEHFRPEFMMREGLADTPGRREFVGLLAKRGWLRLGWPKEYGGIPSTPMMRVILNEELAYAGAPNLGISVLAVGQGILHYGTEELKKEFEGRSVATLSVAAWLPPPPASRANSDCRSALLIA